MRKGRPDRKRAPLARRPLSLAGRRSALRLGLGVVALLPLFENGRPIVGSILEVVVDHLFDEVVREVRHRLGDAGHGDDGVRSEEQTSELQSLMRNSYAVFCLKKKKTY